MASDRSGLTPHRRKHWSVEPAAPSETPRGDVLSPEETRVEAKRLLWRDSAIILIGIILAVLVAQFLPALAPGLVADQTSPASGPGSLRSLAPGASAPPDATFGPVVDPSLGIDATRPPSLPPTGTFKPVETDDPTPKPTKRPAATIGPPTPPPTPAPTPTPEVTPIPPPTVSISCSVLVLEVTCEATTSHTVAGSQRWSMDGDGLLVLGGDGSNSIVWTYLEGGSHTVTLTVDGDDGSQASDSEEVNA